MPSAQCPGMWQPTIQSAPRRVGGTVQVDVDPLAGRDDDPQARRRRGGTLTTGVGPGGAPAAAASAASHASWTCRVADDRLVDRRGRR